MTELEKLRPWCEEAMQEAMKQCKSVKQKFHVDNASNSPKISLVEIGNCAAMREAFVRLHEIANTAFERMREGVETVNLPQAIWYWYEKAMSAPPRNCDVGTVEEQMRRKREYCKETQCSGCPANMGGTISTDRCNFVWAQMPYKEKKN